MDWEVYHNGPQKARATQFALGKRKGQGHTGRVVSFFKVTMDHALKVTSIDRIVFGRLHEDIDIDPTAVVSHPRQTSIRLMRTRGDSRIDHRAPEGVPTVSSSSLAMPSQEFQFSCSSALPARTSLITSTDFVPWAVEVEKWPRSSVLKVGRSLDPA